jgi:type I restriction enzyme S subunit
MNPVLQLGDIASVVMGQAPPGKDCNKEGNGHPFVKAGEFSADRPVIREWTTNPLKKAKEGDVLVCVVGATAGKVNLGIDCAIGRSVAAVRPLPQRLDTNYLHHFLKTKTLTLRHGSQGLAQGVITREMLLGLEIPLPPLEEQRRIAAILDKVALLIQSAAHAFFLSQELKKSLVHETLGLAREGDERVRIKVSEVANIITGFPFKSAQYTDKAQHTRLCRGINVLPDRIEWKQVARWPEITPELRSYQIDEDDILIAMDRPWITEGFKIARVKPIDIPSLLVQRVARIRAGNQILPRILFEVLSSKAFATHCTPTETTVPHISPIEIREYEFELPCLKEQKRIDSILAEIEKSQAAMNQRANLLKEKLCTLSRSYFN